VARRRRSPRAVGLTVTLETERLNTRLNVSGLSGATYTITRTGPSGTPAAVRGAERAPVTGATAIARDFEVPLDVPLTYQVTAYDAAGNSLGSASAAFQVAYDDCQAWLTDLARPTNTLPLTVESMAELAYESAAAVHRVLDRRTPVMTTLPAWTPSTELIVLTTSLDERDRVRDIFGSGYPVLIRTDPEQGIGNFYVGLTDFTEERLVALGVAPQRRFRATCHQVERPDPGIFVPTPPNLYSNVKATYADYAALTAAVASYDELAYTYPGGQDPVSPWPPSDV
jgi:hypothetical protein